MSRIVKPKNKGLKIRAKVLGKTMCLGEDIWRYIGFLLPALGPLREVLRLLRSFFHNIPVDTGIAFVLIMHLDPTKKGSLPELIQRFTGMPVKQAGERYEGRARSCLCDSAE